MRKKLQTSFLSLLLPLLMTAPSQAQDTSPPEDIICTTIAYIWSGTLDETKSIEADPVPDSFANRFNGSGCARFQLVETSILRWHRDFGNASTMRAAIEFLSADILKKLDRPFSPNAPEDIEFQSRAYATIANYYVIGAEAHESVSLIDEAIAYYKKAEALAQKIPSNDSARLRLKSDLTHVYFSRIIGGSFYSNEDLHLALRQLSQDIYVMRAYITGDKDDVIFAEKLLADQSPEFIKETLKSAEKSFERICDTEDETLRKKMDQVCSKTSEDYKEFVREHLLKKGLLAAVKDGSPNTTYPKESNKALSDVGPLLLNSERRGTYSPLDPLNFHNAQWFKALIANSDAYIKLGEKNSDDGLITKGLERLVYAERYMPRHASPSQWKRLATRYVDASALLEDILGDELDDYYRQNRHWVRQHNQLKYFQNGLADLDRSQKSSGE